MMNGYAIMAKAYRKMVSDGKISEKDIAPKIKVLDILATCSDDDIYNLVDSGAFNDIIRSYTRMVIDTADIDEKTKNKVKDNIYRMFEYISAEEVTKVY